MIEFIKSVLIYLSKRQGVGTLLIFSIYIYSSIDSSFISNMPFIGKMILNEKQFHSMLILFLLVFWVYFLKAIIQLVCFANKILFDMEWFAQVFAKRMIFFGWGFFILLIFSNNKFLSDILQSGGFIWESFVLIPISFIFLFTIGAVFYGLVVEEK
ncbi:hypothetical protein HB904_11040 [Listeria booriae]|uniref:Uncharacterized protein n=1 Tax=Listeria booriae TaxID=1552123 RepID=A0A841YKF7_9LIST|nr:hypothetical protein [Listeria booriae]MBC1400881.1 hypothetical protein [Listeria booriae]MBC1616728.1 hypothetical protein [Listeria booriae]